MSESSLLPVLDDHELLERFSKIKPLMTTSEALVESSRCLFCHDAPCTYACPTLIDIPMFIRQIMTKNLKGAAKTILSQNILGKSCGEVCPTLVLCEGACVYNGLNKKPIDIGRLQAFATNYVIENNIRFFKAGIPTDKRVAVVGAGPAGLACAHELTTLGHHVTLYEANEKPGGLNTYGVAPYKFSNEDAIKEINYISEIGFEIKTNSPVITQNEEELSETKNGIKLSDLENNFDAIFLAVGLGKSKTLGIVGENLKGVYKASDFIYLLRKKEQKIEIGSKVIVVGAGNTAMDAAIESSKLGAEVSVVYRRSTCEQSAYDFEIICAKKHDVKFMYLTSPVEILGKKSVEGLRCVKNKLVKPMDSNKPKTQPIPNSEFIIPCNMVIFATGQEKMMDFFSAIPNLELDHGKVIVNKDFQTTNPKYFAGGDCTNGGKEVVHAVSHGHRAAHGINKFLMKRK